MIFSKKEEANILVVDDDKALADPGDCTGSCVEMIHRLRRLHGLDNSER